MSHSDCPGVCPPVTLTVCCPLFLRRFPSLLLLLLLQLAATTATAQHSQLSLGDRKDELAAGPLRLWRQDRYVRFGNFREISLNTPNFWAMNFPENFLGNSFLLTSLGTWSSKTFIGAWKFP